MSMSKARLKALRKKYHLGEFSIKHKKAKTHKHKKHKKEKVKKHRKHKGEDWLI